jgi:hypothetical protein
VGGETLFFMMQPQYSTYNASPAPLRLTIDPALGGLNIGFVKRSEPQVQDALLLPLSVSAIPYHQPRQAVQVQPVKEPLLSQAPQSKAFVSAGMMT